MKKNRSISAFLRRNGVALLCAAGLYILFFQVVMSFGKNPASADDYRPHMLWAISMSNRQALESFYNGTIKLWHIFVKYVYVFQPNVLKAAATVTAAADTVAYYLLFKIWDRTLPGKFPRWLLAALTLTVFLVQAIVLPGGAFYIDRNGAVQGAVNTWHNPTNVMVRPFALAVFYMTVNIYNRRRYGQGGILPPADGSGAGFAFEGGFWRQFTVPVFTRSELILYPVCLLLSAYAKPSFLQFFGPAILLFLLIDVIRTRGMLLPFCIKLALTYIPVSFVIYRQFFASFHTVTVAAAPQAEQVASSIVGGPHGVQIYAPAAASGGLGQAAVQFCSDWAPLLLFCAFPLFVMAISPKESLRSSASRLGLLCAFAGRLEAVLLHETGSRATHGNFMWGFSLAAWTFWAACLGRYALLLPEKSRRGALARYGGGFLLLCHLAAGAAYIWLILTTHDYLY